jgi:hypothetical protein
MLAFSAFASHLSLAACRAMRNEKAGQMHHRALIFIRLVWSVIGSRPCNFSNALKSPVLDAIVKQLVWHWIIARLFFPFGILSRIFWYQAPFVLPTPNPLFPNGCSSFSRCPWYDKERNNLGQAR